MSVGIDTIKCFLGKLAEKYRFKKKSDSQHENTILMEPSVNEVMQTIMAGENDLATQDPIGNVTDEDALMELFDQFSGWMSPVLD